MQRGCGDQVPLRKVEQRRHVPPDRGCMKMTRGDLEQTGTCWGTAGGAFEVAATSDIFTHGEVESHKLVFKRFGIRIR